MFKALTDTVFLVSGGGRGVTARCVVQLARAAGSKFVLLGRTPLDDSLPFPPGMAEATLKSEIASFLRECGERPAPASIQKLFNAVTARDEIRRTLQDVADAGGVAEYVAADVTDPVALREALAASSLGKISGIIHGAGVISDRLIQDKTEQDFDRVYATKVHGLRAMLGAVDVERLRYLALFSSITGFYGNRGQADYAIANEVLNKFAHAFKRRVPSCHTTVFDWGPWDGGMVGPQLKAMFESHGVSVMSVARGSRLFVDALTRTNDTVQMVVNDGVPAAPETRAWRAPVQRIARTLRLEGNPFLHDHVISGRPVLPAACAGVWIANACQQLRPGYRFFSLNDFRVLKGVVFDESLADRYILELKEVDACGEAVTLSAMISSTTRDQKLRYHYSGEVRLVRTAPAAPVHQPIDPRQLAVEARPPYGESALFHGPAFQVITRVLKIASSSITVECTHPDNAAGTLGQFPAEAFDAVCQDAQFQSVGLWALRFEQAAALPSSYQRFECFEAPPAGEPFYISAEIEHKTTRSVRATVYVHDAHGRIFSQATGTELTFSPRVDRVPAAVPIPRHTGAATVSNRKTITRTLRELERTCYVLRTDAGVVVTSDESRADAARATGALQAVIPAISPAQLGSECFRRDHGVTSSYMAGAMAKGIASEDMIIALGKEGLLGSFGAGGLPPARVEAAIVRIKEALPTQPYAFNLLHSPKKLAVEDATVDLYLKHDIRTVEASSYVGLTPSIVRYRLAGLRQRSDGAIEIGHRVIVKLSRVELAAQFMQPSPPAMVQQLVDSGRISPLQAQLAQHVPIADDVTVEADSGGHTDSRPLVSLLPAMLKLRDDIQQQRRYPAAIRVGAAGGIATPQAVLAAFMMGADYVVTGSVNQSCVEAGTSRHVKELLATLGMTDVAMAPEADMFEQGVRVQVAKQGSLFPMRAQKLFDCYQRYDGLDAIPEPERRFLERQIFRDSLDSIWRQTADYLSANKPEQLVRAADPKVKMSLLFKWYLGQTSRWAADGHADRQLDYQVWCGPAMGAFNAWAGGTYLEIPENRRVADIARVLMSEAACLYRLNLLKMHGFAGLTGVN
jgi:trans-AT polyketide synthase/acyltransferase/oxidoreductase domain-containing protein